MNFNYPKISIITVVYNRADYIEETILSVLNQSYSYIEYIIIDGKSTDGTVDIIRKYEDKITYFLSEKDESMYDAINKGLKKVTGDFILILNSDDRLVDNQTIGKLVKKTNTIHDVFYGNIFFLYKKREFKIRSFQINKKKFLLSKTGACIPHPALFVSAKTLLKVSQYNTEFKYASDYDYILELLDKGFTFKYIDIFITKFRLHEGSITSSGKLEMDKSTIAKNHGIAKYSKMNQILTKYIILGFYRIKNFDSLFRMLLMKFS